MRNLIVGMLFGILIVAVPTAFTQQESERIYIGADLQLGMAKDSVISKVAEQGLKVTKVQELGESWIVTEKNEKTNEYDAVGMLTFSNGRLSWASRTWIANWDANSAKLAKNMYFLAKSLEDSGNSICTLETQSGETPDLLSKSTLIHCGRRTISVNLSRIKEQNEETQLVEVVK